MFGKVVLSGLILIAGIAAPARAQLDFEKQPVDYGQTPPNDPLAQLIKRMEAGEVSLNRDEEFGWLPDVLKALKIDPQSQVLVFSKTSLQLHRISPRSPRAIYFNDDVYVGYCHHGDQLEIAATDPFLGAVFYTIDQTGTNPANPKIIADRGQCLSCHATNRTQGVPGYLVRSVYTDFSGRPRPGARTFVTDHSTEFQKRFGGWYVTGDHGAMRHLGNSLASDGLDPEQIDCEAGANQSDLSKKFSVQQCLTPHSDIVALMLLEHQSQMHNLMARASIETRIALFQDDGINEALERPQGTRSESTVRRIARAADDLVHYMLFADEFPLDGPIRGNTQFAQNFQDRAKAENQVDSKGRSLRDFDLQSRLFKYPCSYLIYSDAFRQLPLPVFDQVRQRLHEVLAASEPVQGFERLTKLDRTAILEILSETYPGLFDGCVAVDKYLGS